MPKFTITILAVVLGGIVLTMTYQSGERYADSKTELKNMITDRDNMINSYRAVLAKSSFITCTEDWDHAPVSVTCVPAKEEGAIDVIPNTGESTLTK